MHPLLYDFHPLILLWPLPAPQVPDPSQQHRIMIEAVENHMPRELLLQVVLFLFHTSF